VAGILHHRPRRMRTPSATWQREEVPLSEWMHLHAGWSPMDGRFHCPSPIPPCLLSCPSSGCRDCRRLGRARVLSLQNRPHSMYVRLTKNHRPCGIVAGTRSSSELPHVGAGVFGFFNLQKGGRVVEGLQPWQIPWPLLRPNMTFMRVCDPGTSYHPPNVLSL
jgi:hypothetical protein